MWCVTNYFDRLLALLTRAPDVPSHVYQYTFAGNPNWSKFYAGGEEIQNYLKDVAWRYDVEKYVRLQHLFEKADWDEAAQKWTVTVKNLETGKVSGRARILTPTFLTVLQDCDRHRRCVAERDRRP